MLLRRKVHEAQMLTYLKLTNISTGLLISFNESSWLKELTVIKYNSVVSVTSVSIKVVKADTYPLKTT
jgi:hypothetical protein